MYKLLMWNSIDYLRKYFWILIGMAISILLAMIPGSGALNGVLTLFSAFLGLLSFAAGILFAASSCFLWMENGSSQLELSLPVATWKILLAKLVLALLVNTISCLFVVQLFVFLGKNANGVLRSMSVDDLETALILVLLLTVVDSTILFSYLASKSNMVTKNIWMVSTLIMSMLIFGLITVGSIFGMAASGAMMLPTVSNHHLLTIDGTMQVITIVIPIVVSLLVVFLEYLGSSVLLSLRYHVN